MDWSRREAFLIGSSGTGCLSAIYFCWFQILRWLGTVGWKKLLETRSCLSRQWSLSQVLLSCICTHLSIYVASKNVHVYPFARLLDPGACHKLEFLRPSFARPRPKMHNCLKLSLHQIWLTVYNCTYLLSCEIETNTVWHSLRCCRI